MDIAAAHAHVERLGEKLSIRDRRFVAGLLEGKSAAQAFREAGFAPDHADANAARKLRQDSIRQYVRACAAAEGIDDGALMSAAVNVIKTATEARRLEVTQGRVVDLGPDYGAQVNALTLFLRLSGLL